MRGKKQGLEKHAKAAPSAKGQHEEDKPKKRRSGRSNWRRFNEERKALSERILKQKKQAVPARRCRGKQTCARRLIQRAIRLDDSDAEDTAAAGSSVQTPRQQRSQGTQTDWTFPGLQPEESEEWAEFTDDAAVRMDRNESSPYGVYAAGCINEGLGAAKDPSH